MSPYFHFTLTEDAYNRYESILAEQGISVEPKSRDTFELLDGSPPMISVHGCLRHEGDEFPFTIKKHSNEYSLTVEAFQNDRAHGERLMAALERAFPQPERGILQRPRPERGWAGGRIIMTAGCVGCLTFIIAVGYFAVVGIRSLLR
jgi:hypothetical protein